MRPPDTTGLPSREGRPYGRAMHWRRIVAGLVAALALVALPVSSADLRQPGRLASKQR